MPARKLRPVREIPLTDAGNAIRFGNEHGRTVRFERARNHWWLWAGTHWKPDATGRVVELAKETARGLYDDAATAEGAGRREALAKHAIRSESVRALMAMVDLAKTAPGIAVEPHEWDADGWKLNTLSGVIDLRTGTRSPHDRELMFTKLAPVEFDIDARSEIFEKFLATCIPDPDVQGFLQRACGYSLTGDTSEERFFFVYGPPGAGKTSLFEALKSALGDYAITADFETFLARRDVGGPRSDLARLMGARACFSVEVDDGKRLASGLVKLLTGGDRVTVRELYGKEFEFRPSFKLWLAANDEPHVRDDDDALWRRILEVPFTVERGDAERDPAVKAALRDREVSGPAVLAWAVRGCLEWQRIGLAPPDAVVAATRAYRDRMDPIADFIDERCTLSAGAWCSTKRLYEAYTSWCRDTRRKPLALMAFARRLGNRRDIDRETVGDRGWSGIALDTSDTSGAVSGNLSNARTRGRF